MQRVVIDRPWHIHRCFKGETALVIFGPIDGTVMLSFDSMPIVIYTFSVSEVRVIQ
jgi:hypothetical protein